MSEITYTYEVVRVDEPARCMEVVYSAAGRQTMHISARLPYEGETLESVVVMYSPVAYWREQELAIKSVQVGVIGTITEGLPQSAEPAGNPDMPVTVV